MGKILTLVKAICFKGQKGDKGDPGVSVSVGQTTTGAPGTSAAVENVGTASDPILNFTIPQGESGVSIANIAKTSTFGNVDTYTIEMTDGTTYTFTVRNGEHKQAYISQAAYDALVVAGSVDPECYYYIIDDQTGEAIDDALTYLNDRVRSFGIQINYLNDATTIPQDAREWGTYYPDSTTTPFLPGLYLMLIEFTTGRTSPGGSGAALVQLFIDSKKSMDNEYQYDVVFSSCTSVQIYEGEQFILRVKATPLYNEGEWTGGYSLTVETSEGDTYTGVTAIRYYRVGQYN